MRPVETVVRIVDRKRCWFPTCLRGMTLCTISWYSQSRMVWINRLLIIRQMAVHTNCGSTLKSLSMTLDTICCGVCTGQGECCHIMIENEIGITSRVTSQTCLIIISITSNALMFIVSFRVGMTRNASKLSKISAYFMAIHTFCPLTRMLA